MKIRVSTLDAELEFEEIQPNISGLDLFNRVCEIAFSFLFIKIAGYCLETVANFESNHAQYFFYDFA